MRPIAPGIALYYGLCTCTETMQLLVLVVLVLCNLLAQTILLASAVVILKPNFSPSECVKVGSAISFSCTVEDSEGYSATIWSGGVSYCQCIFTCPSRNSISRDRLFLSHSDFQPVAHCGQNAFAQLNSVTNDTLYTSTLYLVNTTLNMDGEYVRCTDLNSQINEQIQLRIEGDTCIYIILQLPNPGYNSIKFNQIIWCQLYLGPIFLPVYVAIPPPPAYIYTKLYYCYFILCIPIYHIS